MSTNLHELTKQLDALTYNSRSVLNALIRSVMAAGSSTGWTVERAGVEVTMTRTDIFLLSSFYTEWEYTRFDKDQFDTIREKLDAQYADGQGMVDNPVTYAIVQHAKIMTMTTADSSVTDNTYWLDKVKQNVNPKLFTNTAPIPINIRTPIYDENLSTKHFDQFETYLFPRSYYTVDTLGYSGDNASHVAGGREWFFDVDDKATVCANRTVLGVQNTEVANIREANYQYIETLRSLAGGTDSYAYGPNSFSYGLYNQVYGKNAVALGGTENFAYTTNGGILGGKKNTVVAEQGAVGGGENNTVAGQDGFAANESNRVGGYSFYFQRYVDAPNTNVNTQCADTLETEDGCIYNLQQSGTGSDASGTIGPNQIVISNAELVYSGFGVLPTRISSGYEDAPTGYADFKVGDTLRIYRPVVYHSDNIPVNMGIYIDKTVTALEMRPYGLVVSFNGGVNKFPGISGEVINGYVSRVISYHVPVCDGNNSLMYYDNRGSYGSSAFGFNNIAGGLNQTVVGQSNNELLNPLFIVGNGSSQYISNSITRRNNAMVVAENYTYMQTGSKYITFGISDYSTASSYVHGDASYLANRKFDEDYLRAGIEKYAGVYAYDLDSESLDDTRAVLRVSHKLTVLGIGNSCVVARPMSTTANPNNNKVLLEAMSSEGAVGIHTDGFDEDSHDEHTVDNDWMVYYSNRVQRGGNDRSITLWAWDNVGIHGTNGVELHSSSYINCEYGVLTLHGVSLGALTADTSDRRGLMDFQLGTVSNKQDISYIKYPGHYFLNKDSAISSSVVSESYPEYSNAYHVISSTHYISRNALANGNLWSTAQLILPGEVSCGINEHVKNTLPHPRLQVQTVNYLDDPNMSPEISSGFLAQELAYLSDVDNQYKGVVKTLPSTGTYYLHIGDIVFESDVYSTAGAMLAMAWVQNGGSCGEGLLTVLDSNSVVNGKCVILNATSTSSQDLTDFTIRILRKSSTVFEVWSVTENGGAHHPGYVTSMKLVVGHASVNFDNNAEHTTVAVANLAILPWKVISMT